MFSKKMFKFHDLMEGATAFKTDIFGLSFCLNNQLILHE